MSARAARIAGTLLLASGAATLGGCGGSRPAPKPAAKSWPLPNADLSSTRSLSASGIDRANVSSLKSLWRFRIPITPGDAGALTATPVVSNGVVYVQDMKSNVYALDLRTGKLRWRRHFGDSNPGPDGLATAGPRIFGATDTTVFALAKVSGRLLWTRRIVTPSERYLDVAPQVAGGLVYTSTVGYPPHGRGALYALDAATGSVRWKLSTIARPWRFPEEAGGGGAWYPPSVGGRTVYWGTANPLPYGGSRLHPNGGAYAGPALYTDSLLAVDARNGSLIWYDQVTRHDVRDYDFQVSPILGAVSSAPAVFGAGKAGVVIAWDRKTHKRLWSTEVGIHHNDRGPLPRRRLSVCPGLLGGVETPMGYADGRLFVPVVDLCMQGSAYGYEALGKVDVTRRGGGELVALDAGTGNVDWKRMFGQADFGCATVADGVVFTSTFDGTVYGLDTRNGKTLWRASASEGINACPALAGGVLLVGAGVPNARGKIAALEAFAPAATRS